MTTLSVATSTRPDEPVLADLWIERDLHLRCRFHARMQIVIRLSDGGPRSIVRLTEGSCFVSGCSRLSGTHLEAMGPCPATSEDVRWKSSRDTKRNVCVDSSALVARILSGALAAFPIHRKTRNLPDPSSVLFERRGSTWTTVASFISADGLPFPGGASLSGSRLLLSAADDAYSQASYVLNCRKSDRSVRQLFRLHA